MHETKPLSDDFVANMVEQLQRIAGAARAARRDRTPLPPIACAFYGHTHENYGMTRGHVHYACPECGNVIMQ
jgi:transposase-like protein